MPAGSVVLMEGTIERIIPQSGAIERCPECGRVLVNDHCVVHLDVDPDKEARVKAGLDTGNTLVFGTDQVEHLLGLTADELHALPERDALTLVQETFTGKSVTADAAPINGEDGVFRVERIASFE